MARWAVLAWVLAEVAAFVLVGGWTSVWAVLGLVALAALIGMALLRRAGLGALRAARATAVGRDPVATVAAAGVQVVAGLLFLLPGFLSDLAAVALLIAPLRRLALAGLVGRAASRRRAGAGRTAMRPDRRPGARPDPQRAPPIADAEWEEVAPPPPSGAPRRPDGSGWTRD